MTSAKLLDLYPELKASAGDGDFAEAWRPEEAGSQLRGRIVRFDSRVGEHSTYAIVTVETTDGEEFAWHAFHSQAARALRRANPSVNDTICATYGGKVEQNGHSVHKWTLTVGAPASEPAPGGVVKPAF
jgi:hypothetical protein